jgi:preprotein translocase subunit Sec61beta
MSRRKRRSDDAPMPTGSAGLLRFYSEKTASIIKVRPEIVIAISIAVIVLVLVAHIYR